MRMWRHIEWENCLFCGDAVQVETDHPTAGWSNDGDNARCIGCGEKGTVSTDGEGNAWITWEEDCK